MQKFWNFFIDNYRLTYLLIAAILLFGLVSIMQMPKESSPEVDIPVAVISTSLPGATAQNVEELVTNPIENQIQGISTIDALTSTSATGFSQIVVEFSPGSDTDDSVTDLQDRVERASSELPSDAGSPTVQKISFSDLPILSLSVSGDYDTAELKRYAEVIEREAESVGSVSRANVIGAPVPVVEVRLNSDRLAQFSITPSAVISAMQQANSEIPIGSITTGGGEYNLRFAGRLTTAGDIQQVPVTTAGGRVVLVEDIATVSNTYERQSVLARLSTDGAPVQSAVSVQIFKLSGEGDILSITDEINSRIDALIGNELPGDLVIERTQDSAELIRTDLANLISSGAVTMVIIFFSLLAFLGWREAVLATLAIPTTFLSGFIVLNYLGLTINFLTLFSLILALGILVDAAIVVTEGISARLAAGDKPLEAARNTIDEFAAPLTAGTLTTVFAFFPMLLAGGIIGEFIKSIPITVTVVLVAALFIALGIITTLASRFFAANGESRQPMTRDYIDRAYHWYSNYIDGLLKNAKRSKRFLITIIVLFVLAISAPFTALVSLELFPPADMDTVTVGVELPAGTPLEETSRNVEALEEYLQESPYVASFATTVGSAANPGSVTTGTNSGNEAGIIINLKEDREMTSTLLIPMLERDLNELTAATVSISQESAGPPQGSPVQVTLTGSSLTDLDAAAVEIASRLEEIEGTRNVDSGVSDVASDFVLDVNTSQAQRYGVTAQQAALLVRSAVSGLEGPVLKADGEETQVRVLYSIAREQTSAGAAKIDVTEIESLVVQTPQGGVPLSAFADVSLERGQSSIAHEDTERVITVSADVAEGASAPAVTTQISRLYNDGELDLPDGVTLSFGGEAEDIQESFTDLFLSMIIGILLIFALLVWQFSSFRTPLIMLSTIPLAFIGVLGGLAITAQPLSFPAFIGVVALAGIVVNNAIILIDRIIRNRLEGTEQTAAIQQAAESRLQPILLTTITTVGGMIPLVFADPSWAPLAYAVIFGLLFSTVLTLVVVPLLYQRFEQ